MTQQTEQQYMVLPIELNIPYRWSAGIYVGRFFRELRDNASIYANKCPQCGRYLVPPRIVCGRCHVEMGDWVKVGPRGTLLAYTVCEQAFLDPGTGKPREVPYTAGCIQLDGAPVTITHFLKETNPEKLHISMRVQAVFRPRGERRGFITDILHFVTIEE